MNKEHDIYKQAVKRMLPDKEHIRQSILEEAKPPQRQPLKRRLLIPVAACIAALVVVCTAVPSVRAAIAQWFADSFSVQDYIAQPSDARPSVSDIDALIEQTMPDDPAAAANSIEIAAIEPEWRKWAQSLKPNVGDVFFDGKQLIVSFDMGGGGAEFLLGDMGVEGYPYLVSIGNPGYIKLNGEKYAYGVSADFLRSFYYRKYQSFLSGGPITAEDIRSVENEDSAPFAVTIDFSRPQDISAGFEDWDEKNKAEYMKNINKLQQYDPDYNPFGCKTLAGEQLKGVQYVEASLPLIMTDYTKPLETDSEGITYGGGYIGLLKLKFSFDPEAGNANMKTYEINKTVEFTGEGTYAWSDRDSDPIYDTCTNKTIDMTGVVMTVKRMEVYASGAELYVSITCPDSWDERDKRCFLGSLIPRIKADGADMPDRSIQFGLEEQGEDCGMRIRLDVLPSEIAAIDTFEILPVLSYFTGYDDVPYVEGVPTRIKRDDVKGWQEESKELTVCALEFSLK